MPQADATEWDDAAFDDALRRAAQGAIDASGVRLSADQLRRLLDEARPDPMDPDLRLLQEANFLQTTFSGYAYFGAAIIGDANFRGATFSGDADFRGATFEGDADFSGATFGGRADFHGATFRGDADFGGAAFSGDGWFAKATFSGDVFFGATFFSRGAIFENATFELARLFGPLRVFGTLSLYEVVFTVPVRIMVSARRASLDGAVFRAGADVLVRRAEVSLEHADFVEPSLVAPIEGWAVGGGTAVEFHTEPAPRVVSVRHAKLARLTLSGVDLRACRFAGAHSLNALRVERALFAQPPSGRWRRLRWTRRQTIAEEHHWRAQHGHGPGWYQGEVGAPHWLIQASEPPEPDQIAGIYRDLRKGREDNKDEPGAADFYYGEMEMRRHAAKARKRVRGIPAAPPGRWRAAPRP